MDLHKYRRIAQALAESQRLNAELEARVRLKQLELERQYEAVQRLSREAAVADERRRIMADMHDGIGGQLISTLSLVEGGDATPEQVAAALRECIDDLRLAIDSLEPTDHDLLPLLGNLRWRLEPRLRARGITLDWQVQDVPRLACLTPANVLHVLRILQEAFTNVIKHAGARHVRLSTRTDGDRVLVDVRDDGRGMDGADTTRGRGLASMRRRAQSLGGELLLRTDGSGTTLSLALPAA
jgi:signal transduction histidine kinase